MLAILEASVAIWLFYAAWRSARELLEGQASTIHYVAPVHFVFCGLPLLLDQLIGYPAYVKFPGFFHAAQDPLVRILYCIYVSICPVIWFGYAATRRGQPQAFKVAKRPIEGREFWRNVIRLSFLSVPCVLVLLSPDPGMYQYYTPNARMLRQQGPDVQFFHMVISKVCLLSIVCGIAFLSASHYLARGLAIVVPLLTATCWIHGKRNAVAFCFALGIYAIWRRGDISKGRLLALGCAAVVGFMMYSAYYQRELRFTEEFVSRQETAFWYDHFRIDYGRDDVIRLAISREVHPQEGRILRVRGESLAALATLFVPRSLWPDKPESYARAVTEQAMHELPKGSGSVTTSVLDESVANFGWAGFFIGPVIIIFVCAIGDRSRLESVHALTLLIVICLQVVHVTPWAIALALWLCLLAWEHFFLFNAGSISKERLEWRTACGRTMQPIGRVVGYGSRGSGRSGV